MKLRVNSEYRPDEIFFTNSLTQIQIKLLKVKSGGEKQIANSAMLQSVDDCVKSERIRSPYKGDKSQEYRSIWYSELIRIIPLGGYFFDFEEHENSSYSPRGEKEMSRGPKGFQFFEVKSSCTNQLSKPRADSLQSIWSASLENEVFIS